MVGNKARQFKLLNAVSLDDLVPQDNFYRQLEQSIDLSFVHELVGELYSNMGRPSIDPVVFFKLQLIAFFEGIRSERQLMEVVKLNLAHRWYLGYDLDEPVPDHSSLSKIRERYRLKVFQVFFEKIVEQCIEAGLVWGEELFFDSTKVQANASIKGMTDRVKSEASHHLKQFFQDKCESPSITSFDHLVARYKGKRYAGFRKPTYKRITDKQLSPTDPDAAPMQSTNGDSAALGYRDHYVVDGGKARIILCALVTPASITDNAPLLDLVDWVQIRWHVKPKRAIGDAKYGTVPNIVGLEEEGIQAFFPTSDYSQRTGYFPAKDCLYDFENDYYTCPVGHHLKLHSRRKTEKVAVYRISKQICNQCQLKSKCTGSKSGRYIFRSFYQSYLDRAEAYRNTELYQKSMRKRSVWIEPLFGEAKDFHRLRRFRLRGLNKVNIEGLMVAAGQNLNRLVKHRLEHYLKIIFRQNIVFFEQ